MSEEIQNGQNQPEKTKKKLTKLEKKFRSLHRVHHLLRPIFPYKKHGHTQPYNDRAYIIVGNHRSYIDVLPVALATDRPVHFIAKKALWEKGVFKKFVVKCECIPVNRDGGDVRAMMTAIKYLRNGENIGIFPEGTRNKTDEIFLPLKSGAAALAIRTKTPIIIVIALKKFRPFRRHHVIFSEPFELTEYYDKKLTDEDVAAADEQLRLRMVEEYYRLCDLTDKKKKKQAK